MRATADRAGWALWLSFFGFATSAALLFQKLLLPLVPALHAGHGLLHGDAIRFHEAAAEAARAIAQHGWAQWSLYPEAGLSANIGFMAALYALFGADPAVMVPVNAALHATGGVLLFRIGCEIADGPTGRLAGLIAAVLFVAFPSSLNWYAQVHKDGLVIVGVLLPIWSWLWLRGRHADRKALLVVTASTLAGIAFTGLARSYLLSMMLAAMGLALVIMLVMDRSALARERSKLGLYVLSLALIAVAPAALKPQVTERYPVLEGPVNPPIAVRIVTWERSAWLPAPMDRMFESVVRVREEFVRHTISHRLGSTLDVEVRLDSAGAVLAYLPRALQIGLFAPFPGQWIEASGVQHKVAAAEMLLWYLLAPGVLIAAYRRRSTPVAMVLCFAAVMITIYAVAIPNVGTLYRMRYAFLFLCALLGLIGWLDVLMRREHGRVRPDRNGHAGAPPASTQPGTLDADLPGAAVLPAGDGGTARSRRALLGAGSVVALFTGFTFMGLFLRDAILARWFGVGAAMDAFFVATALPMFVVSVLSLPLGAMLIPPFLALKERQSAAAAQAFISRVLACYAIAAVIAAGALLWGLAPLLGLIGWNLTPGKLELTRSLLGWMLPVLVLSGFVVVASSLLNALNRYTLPSAAQLAVPAASVLALVALGGTLGVAAALIGMLVGQVVNLLLVASALSRSGFSVVPRLAKSGVSTTEPLGQYLALVAGALLVNVTTPVNLGMASSLGEGAAATLGLGTKVVAFMAGLIAAGVTTTVLPYFAALAARYRLAQARDELSFLLLAGTAVTIPLTLALLAGAETIVRVAFEGGVFGPAEVQAVSEVARHGVFQIPFFTANLLLLRFAIATRHAGRVLTSSLLALCINVALNLLLMERAGTAGIALAASLAVALSTCFMLALFNRLGHIPVTITAVLYTSWLSFAAFVASWHAGSGPGMTASALALLALLYSGTGSSMGLRPAR